MGDLEQKTSAKRGKKPEWNEELEFKAENCDSIQIELWDKGMLSSNSLLGTGNVSLKNQQDEAFWIPLYSTDGSYEGKLQLEWKITLKPLAVNKIHDLPKRMAPAPKLFETNTVLEKRSEGSRTGSNRSLLNPNYDNSLIVNDGSSQYLQASRDQVNSVGTSISRVSLTTPVIIKEEFYGGGGSSVSLDANRPVISSDTLSKYSSLQRGSSTKFLSAEIPQSKEYLSPVAAVSPYSSSHVSAPPLPPRSRSRESSQGSVHSDALSRYSSLQGNSTQSIHKEPGSPKRMYANDRPGSPKRTHYAVGSNEYMNHNISSVHTGNAQFPENSGNHYQGTYYNQQHNESSYKASILPKRNSLASGHNGYTISPNDSISTVGMQTQNYQQQNYLAGQEQQYYNTTNDYIYGQTSVKHHQHAGYSGRISATHNPYPVQHGQHEYPNQLPQSQSIGNQYATSKDYNQSNFNSISNLTPAGQQGKYPHRAPPPPPKDL